MISCRASMISKSLMVLLIATGLFQAEATTWKSVAIGGGGFVVGMSASSDGSGIYMRTDVGGAYRWDDANASWHPLTDTMTNDVSNNGSLYGTGAIAADPSNPNRLFLACGKYDWSTPSGIYCCNDTRIENPTWTAVDPTVRVLGNEGFRSSGERLAVDPYNANVVYFGTYNLSGISGLRKYTYDTAWHTTTLSTPVFGDGKYGISFVAADRNGGSISDGTRTVTKYLYIGVYSVTNGNGGVFSSTDGGVSWIKAIGLDFNRPCRGEVALDGTLYVTGKEGVAKMARDSNVLTSITPEAGLAYNGLAVDPANSNIVMVAEVLGNERLWRSVTSGSTWVVVNRTTHTTEPDGTRSLTSGGKFNNIADILITPGRSNEVWATDFIGVQRTQNIQDNTTASDWYSLQKNHEEVVVLMLKSSTNGAPILSAVADVNGFVHNQPETRPSSRYDYPISISTTGIDFSEGTGGRVWARVGDLFYYRQTDDDRTGGTSINGGKSWSNFGQLDSKSITNSLQGGWETLDVSDYLRQQKALGMDFVTLVLRSSAWQTNQKSLHFSSKEGSYPPTLLINGNNTLTNVADATVYAGSTNANYGSSTELVPQNYYEQTSYLRWCFLKFDLRTLGAIDSAVLNLYRLGLSDTTGARFSTTLYASPTTNWVESSITWANKPTDLLKPPSGATGGRIAVSATSPWKLVWVAENGLVWYSKDRGMTWARGTLNGNTLAVDSMTEFNMERAPLSSDRVLADTFYLFSKTGSGTLYRSTDGGATWSAITSGTGAGVGYKVLAAPAMAGQFWFLDQNWNVGAHFKYWTGSSLVNVPNISGAVDFAFGKSAPGCTNPIVYVRKSNGTYWYSEDATGGSTFTWKAFDAPAVFCQPTVMEGDLQQYGRLYVGTGGRGILYADTITNTPVEISTTRQWDGGPTGTGTSWNDPTNWSEDTLPRSSDTAVFTDSGLTANKVISLDANQTISNLVLQTTMSFTIGNTFDRTNTPPNVLTLINLERQDVAGTEGMHILAAPINLMPDVSSNSTWTINGSDVLRMNAPLGAASTPVTFIKLGTGTFNMYYRSPTFTGPWIIREGTVTASYSSTINYDQNGTMRGNATIGGTSVPALLAQSQNALFGNLTVTVLTNGTFTASGASNGRVDTVHVKEGGIATISDPYFYCYKPLLTGGKITAVTSGRFYNGGYGQKLESLVSDRTAFFNCEMNLSTYYDAYVRVADGAPAIDLDLSAGSIYGNAKTLSKEGSGTVVFGKSSSHYNSDGTNSLGFIIKAGTAIFNNTNGSAVGKNPTQVNGGATLGGTGFLGGSSAYPNYYLLVKGSSSSSLATVTPGSIDATTGESLIGTLSVGSDSANNAVTFGNYSKLVLQIGRSGFSDCLQIAGTLDLSSTSDTLDLTVANTPKAKVYTLVRASGGIQGKFNILSDPLISRHLSYTSTTINYTIIAPTLILTR